MSHGSVRSQEAVKVTLTFNNVEGLGVRATPTMKYLPVIEVRPLHIGDSCPKVENTVDPRTPQVQTSGDHLNTKFLKILV